MTYLKFRPRSGVIHIVKKDQTTYCHLTGHLKSLLFDKKPNGRICAYCQNRYKETQL